MFGRTLVSSFLLACFLVSIGSVAHANVNNTAQVSVAPSFSGGTGPFSQTVIQPGLVYVTGAATGGFSSSGSASAEVNYGMIRLTGVAHGGCGTPTRGIFTDALTVTAPGVTTGTAGTLTFTVRVEGSLSAGSGASASTWAVGADLGGGSYDISKSGKVNSPELLPAGYSGDPLGTYSATISFLYGLSMPLSVELDANAGAGNGNTGTGAAALNMALYWVGISDIKVGGSPATDPVVSSQSGTGWQTEPVAVGIALPGETRLDAAAPNPLSASTAISFDLARAGRVHEEIFDLEGRLVKSLRDGDLPAGHYVDRWQRDDAAGRAVKQGVYVVRLAAPGVSSTRKLVVTR